MGKITASDLEKLAELAHLSLSESEKQTLVEQISEILTYFERIQSIDTKDTPPMSRVGRDSMPFREDVPRGDSSTSSTPEDSNGLFKVPKVLP
jgi:aspartyl-tRNA(Asn)/glutamyl-tRNA(Gln) amidotransferase subunit C